MTQRVVNYTYGTGNPVLPDGSIDARDGIDNLQSMDVFMNAPEDTYNQRDGGIVSTVSGANNRFNAQILNMGFTRVGTFAAGATLTNPRQTLLWDIADGGDGQEYGWSGAFPKVVPATSTPASTGGISVGAWIGRFDPELRIQVREALRRSYAEAGYNLVAGSFEAGGTLVNASDVLLHEASGKAFSGPAGTVASGTDPASGGFVDVSMEFLKDLTVMDFGAKGDGVTDDSAAFQAYCDSPLTGVNIRLTHRKAVYVIKKQVNCKGKGIVGNGFSRQNEAAYSTSSIRVQPGVFSNTDPELSNIAFINVGAEVRDLQLKGDSVPDIHGLQVGGYNTTISNINITGFFNQVYVLDATVSFRVSDLMSINAGNAGFYIKDRSNVQSTTAYFERCSWQWGGKPVVFEKQAYGCSFRDIIIERMGGGLEASVWSSCIFDGIWAEKTLDGTTKDWLINTMFQQSFNNQYSNLYVRWPWLNRANPDSIAGSDNTGGIQLEDSGIAVCSSLGSKVKLDASGISTRFANWIAGRRLRITTQENAAESGYRTPIYIDAPNNELHFGNQDETSATPVTFKRIIGALADGTTRFFGVDMWTKRMRKWQAYDHTVNASGQFIAPMMLTFDSAWTDEKQQNNAGWRITKEAGTTGVYILQRTATTVAPMIHPNIIVGGFHVGSLAGTGAFVTASIIAINSYSSSWSSYRDCSGFKIVCRDQTGAPVDVNRFTAMFTLGSGF